MTEKRFDCFEESWGSRVITDNGKCIGAETVVSLLNDLTKDNEKLKQQSITENQIEEILECYDKTNEDVAEVIAEHLTVSESCLIRWLIEQFRIQFENNLKRSCKND